MSGKVFIFLFTVIASYTAFKFNDLNLYYNDIMNCQSGTHLVAGHCIYLENYDINSLESKLKDLREKYLK